MTLQSWGEIDGFSLRSCWFRQTSDRIQASAELVWELLGGQGEKGGGHLCSCRQGKELCGETAVLASQTWVWTSSLVLDSWEECDRVGINYFHVSWNSPLKSSSLELFSTGWVSFMEPSSLSLVGLLTLFLHDAGLVGLCACRNVLIPCRWPECFAHHCSHSTWWPCWFLWHLLKPPFKFLVVFCFSTTVSLTDFFLFFFFAPYITYFCSNLLLPSANSGLHWLFLF